MYDDTGAIIGGTCVSNNNIARARLKNNLKINRTAAAAAAGSRRGLLY